MSRYHGRTIFFDVALYKLYNVNFVSPIGVLLRNVFYERHLSLPSHMASVNFQQVTCRYENDLYPFYALSAYRNVLDFVL